LFAFRFDNFLGNWYMSQTGGSLIAMAKKALKSAHDFAKKEKLVSRGLTHFGYKKLASHAALAGYGRRKKRRVVRRA